MTGLLERYERLVAAGELRADPDQKSAVERLAHLQIALEAEDSRGLFSRWFGKARHSPRGVYLWGGVGRGKSMLMDLFIDTLAIPDKRRVHFHGFMLQVDQLIGKERAKQQGDPIAPVAARLAQDIRCLAFDELVVNNTADAAIMARLFTALICDERVTIVTTSNRPPDDLYKDGLNRSLFLPFITLIERELDVVSLNGPVDYRLDRIGDIDTWHTPLGDESTRKVREAFYRLTDYDADDAEHVPSGELALGGGRVLFVPKSLKGVAVFSFKRLCGQNRGAADYLALARMYHTLILVGIPQMSPDNRNEAIRFTKLIDALYEYGVKFFATAAAEPADLYSSGDGSFEFARTASRLMEMQSRDYMARGHGQNI